jgi:hypothetical protein
MVTAEFSRFVQSRESTERRDARFTRRLNRCQPLTISPWQMGDAGDEVGDGGREWEVRERANERFGRSRGPPPFLRNNMTNVEDSGQQRLHARTW